MQKIEHRHSASEPREGPAGHHGPQVYIIEHGHCAPKTPIRPEIHERTDAQGAAEIQEIHDCYGAADARETSQGQRGAEVQEIENRQPFASPYSASQGQGASNLKPIENAQCFGLTEADAGSDPSGIGRSATEWSGPSWLPWNTSKDFFLHILQNQLHLDMERTFLLEWKVDSP